MFGHKQEISDGSVYPSVEIFKSGLPDKTDGKPLPPTPNFFNDFKYLSQRKTTADNFQGQIQCYFFPNFVLLFNQTNWENFGNFIF